MFGRIFVLIGAVLLGGCGGGEVELVPFLRSNAAGGLVLTDSKKRRNATFYTFTAGKRTLRIEVIAPLEPDSAKILLDDAVMSLRALYGNALSPYPGDISRTIVPSTKFRPQLFKGTYEGRTYTYVLLFANRWLGHGPAAEADLVYRGVLGWLYAEKVERFYRIEYFVPLDTNPEELRRFFLSLRHP